MTNREALIEAILHEPEDLASRYILADCLEEEGEPDRAQLVRIFPSLLAEPFTVQPGSRQLDSYQHILPENMTPIMNSAPTGWRDPIRMMGDWSDRWGGGVTARPSEWTKYHRFNGMFAVALSYAWWQYCGNNPTAHAAHELYLCGVISHNRRNLCLGCGIHGCSPLYHHSYYLRRMAGHNYNRNVYDLIYWSGARMRPTRHGLVNEMAMAIRDRLIASRWWEPAMRLSLALRRSREPRYRSHRRKRKDD